MGIDDFQAERSPDRRYRTSPLKGLWTHMKGGFFHDGRFATLLDVVNHYDALFNLALSESEKRDLVEYLKSLGGADEGEDTSVQKSMAPEAPASALVPAVGIRGLAPNPTAGTVGIDFALEQREPVDLAVYDVQGREIASLAGGSQVAPGEHRLTWDGRNGSGAECPPGLYFVRLRAAGQEWKRAVVRLPR